MASITGALEQYALLGLEKQRKLEQLIHEHFSELDIDSGKISFHGIGEFPIQVLGTESDNTLTWLWAWAEEQTEIPEPLLNSAHLVKEWGAREQLDEFIKPSIDLNKADGHLLSLISTEITHASCYYRSGYEGGAVYVLLFGEVIDRQLPFDTVSLLRSFNQLIHTYNVNHRRALVSYLQAKKIEFTEDGGLITAVLESVEKVALTFDDHGNLNMPAAQDLDA